MIFAYRYFKILQKDYPNSNIKQLIRVQFVQKEVLLMQFFSIFHINHIDILYNIDEPNQIEVS